MRKEENRIDPEVTKKLRLMLFFIGWLPLIFTIMRLLMVTKSSLDERGEITIGTIALGIVSFFIIPLGGIFVPFSRILGNDIKNYTIPRYSPSYMIFLGLMMGMLLGSCYENIVVGIVVGGVMIGMGISYCFTKNLFRIIACWTIALLVTVWGITMLVTLRQDFMYVMGCVLITAAASVFPLIESLKIQKSIEQNENQIDDVR